VDDEGEIAEESGVTRQSGRELVDVGGREGVCSDLPVLAGKVAYLAGLRERAVAGWSLAADKGIEMAKRVGAISITCDGGCVDVVEEWATLRRQVCEGDLEGNTDAIWVCSSRDLALDFVAIELRGGWESSSVDYSRWVVSYNGSISKLPSQGSSGS